MGKKEKKDEFKKIDYPFADIGNIFFRDELVFAAIDESKYRFRELVDFFVKTIENMNCVGYIYYRDATEVVITGVCAEIKESPFYKTFTKPCFVELMNVLEEVKPFVINRLVTLTIRDACLNITLHPRRMRFNKSRR